MADPQHHAVESPKDFANSAVRWDAELSAYDRATRKWRGQCRAIVKRYRLESQFEGDTDQISDTMADWGGQSQFNILWSNVQTKLPTVYSREPDPVVERRHKDPDKVGRIAAGMLQRAVATDMEGDNFLGVGKRVALDLELCGRGVPWVRYKAHMRPAPPVQEGGEPGEEGGEPGEEVASESSPVDYIHWDDFAHSPARTWEEVKRGGWVAKRVRMTREDGIEHFGDVFKDVSLGPVESGDSTPEHLEELTEAIGTAEVWEIWNARKREVVWISRAHLDKVLKVEEDPLNLEEFFPCPEPAWGTLSNESLVPTPDYLQYRKLADELDEITRRIAILTKALRLRGVYDQSVPGLARLLDEDLDDGDMIGVANFSAYLDNAGRTGQLGNVVQFVPIQMIAEVVLRLYEAREQVKQVLFEVSGISDIVRGQSDPRETLGAQRLKGQYAGQRMAQAPQAVAECMRGVIERKVEIIAEHYSPETIRKMSGFDQMPEVLSIRRKAEQAQRAWEERAREIVQGVQSEEITDTSQVEPMPPQPPDPDQVVDDTFKRALELFRDERTRGFRISIETDSTLAQRDEMGDQERRTEFLSVMGQFLDKALLTLQTMPHLAPLAAESLTFAVRSFKAGRSVESAFEDAADKIRAAAEEMLEAPQEEGPSPEETKVEAEAAIQRLKAEAEQAKASLDIERRRTEAEARRIELVAELEFNQAERAGKAEMMRLEMEHERAKLAIDTEREAMRAESARKQAEAKARDINRGKT